MVQFASWGPCFVNAFNSLFISFAFVVPISWLFNFFILSLHIIIWLFNGYTATFLYLEVPAWIALYSFTLSPQ